MRLSSSDWLIHQTWESGAMSGTLIEDWTPTALSSDYINRSIKIEKEQEFLAITLAPKPGMVLNTWCSVRHDEGHPMQWQAILRPTADAAGTRILYHDFTDVYPPSVPSLAEMGLQQGLEGSNVHIALFDAARGSVVLWIGRPPEWLAWQYAPLNGPFVHPEDLPQLQAAAKRVNSGEPPQSSGVIRLQGFDGHWVESSTLVRTFQFNDHPPHAELTLVQITPTREQG
ncbi:hypothetical protein QMA15_29315 [Rhodococcus sp. APC 3903]|nr:hypothetical protein [Rhodococcus sp. APC 3903]